MSFFRSRSSSSPTDLIQFYEGTGTDDRGRSLSDIMQWNASRLESSHDYIQTVFPLPESSGVNWDAPVIDRKVFDAFRSRPELREKLRESFQKILWFYGFDLEQGDLNVKVLKSSNYDKHSGNWDSRFDHNHLRITRIIRCLRVLGLQNEALAFRSALEENFKHVSPRSREFWRRAAERALNIRPDLEIDDEDDISIGPKFLRDFGQTLRNIEVVAEVKRRTKTKAEPEKNNDFCSSCGIGGALACCEGCVRSFHSNCAEPPLLEETDEVWFCDKCQAAADADSVEEKKPAAEASEVEDSNVRGKEVEAGNGTDETEMDVSRGKEEFQAETNGEEKK